MTATGEDDNIIDVVHRELGNTALHGYSLFGRQRTALLPKVHDDIPGITESGDVTAHIGTIDGRHGTLAIEVCTCIGSGDTIGTKDELWRELLVLAIGYTRGETQAALDGLTEKLKADRTVNVGVA